tara:strand:+ start:1098 stop:1352 length:255 start_codon:yes stop_codon:yes gene_type:complete
MEFRLMLSKNADTIIQNNQNIATGNCSDVVQIRQPFVLPNNPYIVQNVLDKILPTETSDLKSNYLKNYFYNAAKFNPVINNLSQ